MRARSGTSGCVCESIPRQVLIVVRSRTLEDEDENDDETPESLLHGYRRLNARMRIVTDEFDILVYEFRQHLRNPAKLDRR